MKTLPQIYIEEFKTSGGARGCATCRAPAEKSLCRGHLIIARKRFQAWSTRRQKQGLCILCNSEGDRVVNPETRRVHRGVRCAFHRGVNAERCRRWARVNGTRVFAERKALGLCAAAPSHGAAAPGHVYCAYCRRRQAESRARSRSA